MRRTILSLSTLAVCAAVAAQPPGFSAQTVVTGIANASAIAFAPDGRLFVAERNTGNIRIVQDGQLGGVWAQVSSVNADGAEAGLLGIAIDPDFLDNGHVYVLYTNPGWTNVVARLQDVGGQGVGHTELLSFPTSGRHAAGPLEFRFDGTLFVSSGESGMAEFAQTLGNPYGKILRIATDGSIPADNPFVGTPGADARIWSYGHRNPFGLALHPLTGELFETENGSFRGDEVNRIVAGANYGWPVYEGPVGFQDPSTFDAVFSYVPEPSLTGASFYSGALFPAAYRGTLFVTAWLTGEIRAITLDASAQSFVAEAPFYDSPGTTLDVADGPDGCLYALTAVPRVRGGTTVTRFVWNAAPLPSANLAATSHKAVGGSVTLGFVAANGAAIAPWLAFRTLPTPVPTPFGDLIVPPDIVLPSTSVAADARAYVGIALPDDPTLRGRTLHLQAGAVNGTAIQLTNAASLILH